MGLALMLTACGGSNSAGDNAAPMFTDDHGLLTVPAASPLRSHLEVQAVAGGGQPGFIDLPAAVEADPARVANIVAPLSGRVTSLKVGVGQRVRQGQVLAVIASGDMAQAWADNDKARDAADTAKKALDRAQGVHEAGGAAVKDVETAQSAYNQAAAELARTHTRLASLGAGAGHGRDLVLTAPQSGVVTALSVAAGAQVTDPTAALMTVSNLDRVYVTANVAEGQIGAIAPGDGATISLTAYPGQTLHGSVTEVDPVLQPDTRRQKVRIAMANGAGRLMPNMYASVRLAARGMGAVSVPQSALLMNNDQVSVLVEVRPWVFQRRAVRIGDETDTSAHVLSGLAAGERIVVRGGVLLND
jgi:cobalt-zinc-cadmium efflux system membrane fusion protein